MWNGKWYIWEQEPEMKKVSNKISKPGRSHLSPDSVPPRGAIEWDLSWYPQLNVLYSLAREQFQKNLTWSFMSLLFCWIKLRFLNWFLSSFLSRWSDFFPLRSTLQTSWWQTFILLIFGQGLLFLTNGYLMSVVCEVLLPKIHLIVFHTLGHHIPDHSFPG